MTLVDGESTSRMGTIGTAKDHGTDVEKNPIWTKFRAASERRHFERTRTYAREHGNEMITMQPYSIFPKSRYRYGTPKEYKDAARLELCQLD